MAKIEDLTGRKYGKLTVIERGRNVYYGKDAEEFPAWVCECECGRIKLVPGHALRAGQVKSCGCAKSEFLSKAMTARWEKEWSGKKNRDRAEKAPFIRRREWPGNFREAVGREDLREDPYALMDGLEDREKQVLIEYYECHKPFSEIGEALNISKQRVFAIHKKAVEKIRFGKPVRAEEKARRAPKEPRPLPEWVKGYAFTENGIECADRAKNMNKL